MTFPVPKVGHRAKQPISVGEDLGPTFDRSGNLICGKRG
jgi:hypothetical protein